MNPKDRDGERKRRKTLSTGNTTSVFEVCMLCLRHVFLAEAGITNEKKKRKFVGGSGAMPPPPPPLPHHRKILKADTTICAIWGNLDRVAVALAFQEPPDPVLGDVSSGLPEPSNPALGEALRWLWQRPFAKRRGEGRPSPQRAAADWAGRSGRETGFSSDLACVHSSLN